MDTQADPEKLRTPHRATRRPPLRLQKMRPLLQQQKSPLQTHCPPSVSEVVEFLVVNDSQLPPATCVKTE